MEAADQLQFFNHGSLLPKRPYCVDRLGDPLLIRSRASALRRRHIQVNEPSRCQFLLFDVDRGDARFAVDEAGLPQPCWMTISPNGHAHVAYQLNTPVYLQGRAKPLGYLAAVENGVRRKLAADPSYSGFLTRNPVHPDWETLGHGYAVDLSDLAFEVDLGAGPEPVSGIGRNCDCFSACRKHAYRAILKHQAQAGADFDGWLASCERWAVTWTQEHHDLPLGAVEAACIGRSVARWTWERFSAKAFSGLQAARGRKPKRGSIRCSASTTATNEQARPWTAEGISRRTWYRRRARERKRNQLNLV